MNIKKTAKYAAIITTTAALTISSAISNPIVQNKQQPFFTGGKITSTKKVISSLRDLQKFLKKEETKNNTFTMKKQIKTHNEYIGIQKNNNANSHYAREIINILEESTIGAIIIVTVGIGLAELRKATIRYISRWLDKVYSSGKH